MTAPTDSTSDDLRSWSYWRGKYGHEDALLDYYQPLLTRDPVLSAALAQMQIARLAIDARMRELGAE